MRNKRGAQLKFDFKWEDEGGSADDDQQGDDSDSILLSQDENNCPSPSGSAAAVTDHDHIADKNLTISNTACARENAG